VVYEPFNENEESQSIQRVEKLKQDGLYKGLKIVSKTGGNTLIQFVITQSVNEVFDDKAADIHFKGTFAVITIDANDQLQHMYIGDGEVLRFGKIVLSPERSKRAAYKEYSHVSNL